MTGYGRSDCAMNGFKVTVELSSVNRKQGEVAVTLPRELEALETEVRDMIHRAVSRGRITARVILHAPEGESFARMHLNVPLARAYAGELARLARDLKLPGGVTLDHLVRAPGVFQTDDMLTNVDEFRAAVMRALEQALKALVKTRAREGAHLEKALTQQITVMRRSVALVKKNAGTAQQRYRDQLHERIKAAGLNVAIDDERLMKEVVLFADRSDISEELTRLESHFKQFEDCRKSEEPVGRMLDFLAQEMNREVNTIGAKANDAVIAREVVNLKAELEKFREQAQNLE